MHGLPPFCCVADWQVEDLGEGVPNGKRPESLFVSGGSGVGPMGGHPGAAAFPSGSCLPERTLGSKAAFKHECLLVPVTGKRP